MRRLLTGLLFLIIGPAYAQQASQPFNGTSLVTAATVGVTSAQVLTATPFRHLLSLKNESLTASIACALGATAALNTAGSWTMQPGQLLVWSENAVPPEAVNCIASAAATPLTASAN